MAAINPIRGSRSRIKVPIFRKSGRHGAEAGHACGLSRVIGRSRPPVTQAPSRSGDVDNRLGESLRRFLRQVVPYAALDQPMRIPAGEFLRVGTGVRVRGTVGVALERYGGHCDHREFSKPPFEVGVFRLPVSQAEPPAVIVNDDSNLVRVVEGGRAARERRLVEAPLGGSELPDELGKLVPVFVVA
jgi:hypothetical protein